jgi:hypothetical protein
MKKKKENKAYVLPANQRNFNGIEADAIKKVGWYMHYVFDEDECPYGVNIHTHGITENFKHLDLQLCMRVSQEVAHGILWSAFHVIESGIKLEPGKEYNNILNGYKVKAILAREADRDVIRLVLPAKDGTYTGQYAEQLIKTGRENIN